MSIRIRKFKAEELRKHLDNMNGKNKERQHKTKWIYSVPESPKLNISGLNLNISKPKTLPKPKLSKDEEKKAYLQKILAAEQNRKKPPTSSSFKSKELARRKYKEKNFINR